ncbi:hypothetical protein [Bradyrhizobium guangdongense]|uniref:hypothetical protein n=1 Tax=Bradyrhizobium guangdongense TaxID=1325090 RepID=UPI00112679DA|nr:hypothetical protein [Bradyrhizobium guangdongense]
MWGSAGATTNDICKEGKEKPSKATNFVAGLMLWINTPGLREQITASVAKLDQRVENLLAKSGEPGVAVKVDIQHDVKPHTDDREYVDTLKAVQLVGAGTSLEDVWLATVALGKAKDAERLDDARSFFLWFSRKGNNLVTVAVSQWPIQSKAGRLLAEEELAKVQKAAVAASGLSAAVDYLERIITDNALKQKLQFIKDAQAADEKKIAEIDRKLNDALEQKRKAQAIADQFNMIGDALTFAAQKDTIKAIFGKDTPAEVEQAKTPAGLVQVLQTIIKERETEITTISAEKTTVDKRRQEYRSQYVQIIRVPKADYPYQDVPQLQLP